MQQTYDIITVGGGLGGAALAKAMAEHGAKVLVLERERQFRDRVRGEVIVPWGVAEAKTLGVYPLLQQTGGYELRWSDFYIGQDQLTHRDLATTTPQRAGEFSFSHPAMQEVVLQAAADAGAEVRRGVTVRQVKAGAAPMVVVEDEGRRQEVRTRLVVGADGRGSMVRKWTGFSVRQDPPRMLIAGVMFDTMPAPPEDTLHIAINPTKGRVAYLFPQGQGRVRAYTSYHQAVDSHRLQGEVDIPHFVEECVKTGIPAEWYAGVRAIGPLATFDGADTWVEHPYTDGVALIGDAATASDPTWGAFVEHVLSGIRLEGEKRRMKGALEASKENSRRKQPWVSQKPVPVPS